jgi:hypothetical protein
MSDVSNERKSLGPAAMSTNRVSLGFDLRVQPVTPVEDKTRDRAFLDPGRRSPLSADPGVWPMSEESAQRWSGLLPDFLNPLYLAANLDSLVNAYKGEGFSLSNLCPMCVTGDPTIAISLNKRFGVGYFEDQIGEVDLLSAGWKFRGFDVADLDGLISGLKGCDYSEPTWSQLREHYGEHLNDEGLFFDAAVASRFAEVRGLEIRQHAPFVVVGILVHGPISS